MTISPPRDKDTTRLFWSSERFSRLDFEIMNGHLVIFGYSNGQMSVKLENIGDLIEELEEIKQAYVEV